VSMRGRGSRGAPIHGDKRGQAVAVFHSGSLCGRLSGTGSARGALDASVTDGDGVRCGKWCLQIRLPTMTVVGSDAPGRASGSGVDGGAWWAGNDCGFFDC
jgi:hypothetical protein